MDESVVYSGLRDFPELPSNLVERPHLIETIGQLLASDSPVVFLEGEEGSGRTTLCAQFAIANAKNCFSLFIKPASKFAYNPDYLRLLLAEQFTLWLTGERLDQDNIDTSQYESILLRVRRKARSQSTFFVVDGLSQIPKEDTRFVEQIVREVLPIGVDPFRFLISAQQEAFRDYIKRVKAKSFQAIRFSPGEAERLLEGACPDLPARVQLEKLCQGNPGKLTSVKRVLLSGVSAEQIFQSEPAKYLEFVRLEFATIDELDDESRTVIAVLAFGRQEMAIDDLVLICHSSGEKVREVVSSCMFLSTNEQTFAVEFRSEAHRRFACLKLELLRSRAISLQIEHLRRDPTSATAVRLLPSYYQQANNQRAIVDLLSPEHYQRLLDLTGSISALKLRAAFGARSAEELNEATSIFQFALQRSIFSAMGDMGQDAAEVAALVALGQPQRALDIAAQTSARESRLSLLAAYGRKVIEQGGLIDQQIRDYIRETADQIDFSELGEQAGSIAADLVFVDQDLAFEIVDSSTREKSIKSKDAAYARLTVAATLGNASDQSAINERVKQRVTSKNLQLLLSSLSLMAATFTFEEVKTAAEKMEIGRRIYFLRTLSVAGAKRPGVLDVVEYALDQIVSQTEYSPKPKDFSDLAFPLMSEGLDTARVAALIRRIEAQLGLLGNVSTSRDLVELQMRLAQAEVAIGVSPQSRITETYFDVSSIGNLEVRVECIALMLRSLSLLDKTGELERSEGFKAALTPDLRLGLDELLAGTASHFEVARGAIRAMARIDTRDAFDLVGRLNMQDRRDDGFEEIMITLASGDHDATSANAIEKAVSKIRAIESKDAAVLNTIRVAARKEGGAEWLPTLINLRKMISEPEASAEAAVLILRAADECQVPNAIAEVSDELLGYIEKIDSPLDQTRIRFSIVPSLSRLDRERATALYDESVAQRASSPIASRGAFDIVSACLSLISRCYRPLARHGLLTEDLLDRYVRLVEILPGIRAKAAHFADLVCRVWCEGKIELATQISRNHCQPLIDAADSIDLALGREVRALLFVPLYFTHKALAISFITDLSESQSASVLYATAEMAIRKVAPADPWPPREEGAPNIAYSDALEVIEIARRISVDSSFYHITAMLLKAISTPDGKQRISGQQRVEIATKIRTLAAEKLPDKKNIPHEGYLIVTEAQVDRMLEQKGAVWNGLAKRAELIPNMADRAFVLLEVAECIPTKQSILRNELLDDALKCIYKIPSAFDKFGRLEYYVEIVRKYDIQAAKQAVKDAMQLTFDMHQRDEALRCQRNLVDLAETIEPGMSERLAEMIGDEDPARQSAKAEIRRMGEVQKVRRQLTQDGEKLNDDALSKRNLPAAAWKNVESLVAGRLVTFTPQSLSSFVTASGGFSLDDAFPVLAWYVENSARRFRTRQNAIQNIAPLADSLLTSTEVGLAVMTQIEERKSKAVAKEPTEVSGIVVGPTGRVEAFEFLGNWLRCNASDEVVLCDPYFGDSDVDFLKLVLSELPRARLCVLATKEATAFDVGALTENWRRTADMDPPDTEIVLVSGNGGSGVLHDRWLISGSAGLRLGTSINSIGRGKLTEISVIDPSEVVSIGAELRKYARRERMVNGQRIQYSTYSI